ncbi:hypothetical protein KEM48_002811 [Puccinia striiformis f. sp. tritici PST-130]|nr:hypothetical protein KEM48_002811 [Puccinia striiformis f. sp. tritici PST-130]
MVRPHSMPESTLRKVMDDGRVGGGYLPVSPFKSRNPVSHNGCPGSEHQSLTNWKETISPYPSITDLLSLLLCGPLPGYAHHCYRSLLWPIKLCHLNCVQRPQRSRWSAKRPHRFIRIRHSKQRACARSVYQLMGRFLGLNDGSEPIVFYEHSLNLPLGPSTAFVNAQDISSLASKVAVFGFGVVVHHEEVTAVGSNSSTQTNLRVTLHHTDYHTVRRDCVEFDTVYVIPGNAILRGTFGLLQLGREALIVGYMGGYDVKKHSWEVQGLLLSMLSGPQSRGAASPGTLPGSANSRRPNLKRLSGLTANGQGDADKDVQEHNSKRTTFDPASIFPVPSTSQQNVCPDEPREEGQVSDDGEDDDDDPAGDNTFHNTYPDKPSCLSSGSVKGKEKANKPGMLTDAQQKARSNLAGKGRTNSISFS